MTHSATQIVTLSLAGRALGIDVMQVQDVIRLGTVTPVPRAAPWIAGVMNLRGHIVTAIDLRARLGLPPTTGERSMCVVVSIDGEAHGLIVDAVGEVLAISETDREPDPPTLPAHWRAVSRGIVRREKDLILELDAAALLSAGPDVQIAAAA